MKRPEPSTSASSGRGRSWPFGRRHGRILILFGLAAVLAAALAAAAPAGPGKKQKLRIQRAPVALAGFRTRRAGRLQHAPTNLKKFTRPAAKAAARRGARPGAVDAVTAVPPAPTVTSAPANPTTSRNASFSFGDRDSRATLECRLDAATFATCTSPKAYAGLAYGAHTFRVRARNASGYSATTAYSWTINRPPPPAPTITSGPTNPTLATSASFSFTDTDATATFECALDFAALSACVSPKGYPGPLGFGTHLFRVRARNANGLSPTTSYWWTINRPPAPTITSAPANPTTSTSAVFSFTDADASATFECRLDAAAYAACQNPKSYPGPLAYGSHTFAVRARNASGVGAATLYTWTITAPPPPAPPLPTITAQPVNPTSVTSALFSFVDSEAGATFECSLDGAGFAACTSPTIYSALAAATHTFQVRAKNAGGPSAPAGVTWTILPPPPPAPTITSPPNSSTSTSASFSFVDSEAGATFECSLDGAGFAACASPRIYSGLANGDHTFQVRAKNAGGTSPATSASWTVAVKSLKMRLLVISADGSETDYPAIKSYLDQVGVPYTAMVATQTPLTAEMLAGGLVGNFQGVILTTGNLTHLNPSSGQWESAFSAEEWQTLWNYEAQFHVRQVTSYTFPYGAPDDYGLNLATYQDTLVTPLQANLTDGGKSVFPYLNASNPITFKGAWVYLATKRDDTVTPLITTGDGYVIASTNTYPDGRENLAVTAANNPFLLHSQLLSYGLVNWVTRGVFLGDRHVTMDVQIDDLLIDSDMWDVDADSDLTGLKYRMSGVDLNAAAAWQNAVRGNANLSDLKLEFAFNGEGAFGDPPDYLPIFQDDLLTPAVIAGAHNFNFVSHTYDHENVDLSNYQTAYDQLQWNLAAVGKLGLGSSFDPEAFVQPDISGLTNPNFLQAAHDSGIRYLISDTSRPEWNNPSPNAGFYSTYQPSILIIPRHPTNLFYNLRTPDEFVDEYNWFYWKGSPSSSQWKFWDDPQTYAQILDHESDFLLSYLLRWDIDPWMFHQANLGLYDGQHSLLGDLLDATFSKYRAVYNLPVRNLSEGQAGRLMAKRMGYNQSGVDATLVPCQNMTVTVANSAAVPITGVTAGEVESYGGQPISSVQVNAGSPATIPVSC